MIRLLIVLLLVTGIAACGSQGSSTSASSYITPDGTLLPVPQPPTSDVRPEPPVPKPQPAPKQPTKPSKPTKPNEPSKPKPPTHEPRTGWVAPLWEARSASNQSWTAHATKVVQTHGSALLLGTDDTLSFCPAYFSLSSTQKTNFWVYFFSALAKFESNFNPALRYHETTLGRDHVTREPVHSEGLLQLSYQDTMTYSFCDEFDWARDSRLSRTDPRKTILNPNKNLSCGIRILNQIVHRQGAITARRGQYWSTLRPGHQNNKLARIRALTNSIHFCKR